MQLLSTEEATPKPITVHPPRMYTDTGGMTGRGCVVLLPNELQCCCYCAIQGRRSKCDSFVNPIRHLILASHCHPRHQLFPLLLAAGLHLNRAEQAGYNGEQLTRQWNLGNKKRQFGNSTRCVASCSAPIVNNLNSGERSELASFLNDSNHFQYVPSRRLAHETTPLDVARLQWTNNQFLWT